MPKRSTVKTPRPRTKTTPKPASTQPGKHSLNRTLFIADNLPVLRGIDSNAVDLIATDPPFNKGVKDFKGPHGGGG